MEQRLKVVEDAYVPKAVVDGYAACLHNVFGELQDFSEKLAKWAAEQSLHEARLWVAWKDAKPQFWTYLQVILMDVPSEQYARNISDWGREWVRQWEQSKQSENVHISASLHLADHGNGLMAIKQILEDSEINFQKCANTMK